MNSAVLTWRKGPTCRIRGSSFWPENPCQPSDCTQGGSMRPVESCGEQVVAPVSSRRCRRWGQHSTRTIDDRLSCAVGVGEWTLRGRSGWSGRRRSRRCWQEVADAGVSARRIGRRYGRSSTASSISWAAGVVHHVGTGVFITGRIGLDDVPAEQREHLVETRRRHRDRCC